MDAVERGALLGLSGGDFVTTRKEDEEDEEDVQYCQFNAKIRRVLWAAALMMFAHTSMVR